MSIALRGAVQSGGGVYPITLTKPAGVVANDVLVAIQYLQNTWDFATTPPSGFTNGERICDVVNTGSFRLGVWVHVAGGSEPASYDFTNDSGFRTNQTAILLAYSGCDTATPSENIATFIDDTNDAVLAIPDITVNVAGSLRLIINIQDLETIVTGPTGSTLLSTIIAAGVNEMDLWSVNCPSTGLQGALTATYNARMFAQAGAQFILRAQGATVPPVIYGGAGLTPLTPPTNKVYSV